MSAEWDAIADAWIEGTAAGANVYREGLLDAWMLDAVGDVSGRDVVDLGCGEGRFGRMLAARGARVWGVDFCARFIEYATENVSPREQYRVGSVEDLHFFEDNQFDLAVSYVALVDLPQIERAIREAYRVLRPGGRFVVCNLQSMVTAANAWFWDENKNKLHFKLDNYFDEDVRMMRMFGFDVTNYHRTMSTHLNCFINTGFILEGVREPKATPEQVAQYPDVDDTLRVPLFIIYLLRKPM